MGGREIIALTQEGLFSDHLLQEIRSRFHHVASDPISGKRIWLEAASGSLRLKSAIEALSKQSEFADQLGRANPGSRFASSVLDKGLEDVRLFLGARSGSIMPAMSSTHAIFRVVNAVLANTAGTNLVTTDLDHPSVYDSTRQFSETYGKEWRVAHLDPQSGSVTANAILERVDKETCLIGMTHGSNITGAVLDVKNVAQEARKLNPDVYVLVDGVQCAPHAPIDVEDLGADAYVFGPYKVYCVKGIGLAHLSERLATVKHWSLLGKPADNWFLGSLEEATFAAWSAVVDYLCWLGSHFTDSTDRRSQIVAAMEASWTHMTTLLKRVLYGTDQVAGLMDMDHATLHGMSHDLHQRLCLLLFSLERVDSYQGVELYNQAGIRLHNRTRDAYSNHTLEALGVPDGIRLSACHYNTPQEIDYFLEVTARLKEIPREEISDLPQASQAGVHGEG